MDIAYLQQRYEFGQEFANAMFPPLQFSKVGVVHQGGLV